MGCAFVGECMAIGGNRLLLSCKRIRLYVNSDMTINYVHLSSLNHTVRLSHTNMSNALSLYRKAKYDRKQVSVTFRNF